MRFLSHKIVQFLSPSDLLLGASKEYFKGIPRLPRMYIPLTMVFSSNFW